MNILTVANLDPKKYGNFEKYCVTFTQFLREKGHDHCIFFIKKPIPMVSRQLARVGAEVRVGDFRNMGIKESLRLWRFIRENKIDIVHMHFYREYSFLSLLLSLSSTKLFHTYHISGDLARNSRFKKLLKWLNARILGVGINKIFCVSKYAQNKFLNNYCESKDKTEVIYNGVDIDEYNELPTRRANGAEKIRVIAVAWLIPEKGVQYLIKAIPAIVARNGQCEFLVIGDGPYLNELRKMANDLGVSDYVDFYGLRDDVPVQYAGSDIAVTPSIWQEACPYAIIESMACGLPIVTTDAGGNPELVRDGENGLIVKRGKETEIADAISRLAGDQELRLAMGRKSKERAIQFFSFKTLCEKQLTAFLRD